GRGVRALPAPHGSRDAGARLPRGRRLDHAQVRGPRAFRSLVARARGPAASLPAGPARARLSRARRAAATARGRLCTASLHDDSAVIRGCTAAPRRARFSAANEYVCMKAPGANTPTNMPVTLRGPPGAPVIRADP